MIGIATIAAEAGGWQAAWQWQPGVVAVLAALAVATAMLSQSGWRTTLARVSLIGLLVMMLAGMSWSPSVPPLDEGSAGTQPRLLGIDLPAVVWEGDRVPVIVTGLVPAASLADSPTSVELRDVAGSLVARGSLQPIDPFPDRTADALDKTWSLVRGTLSWQAQGTGRQRLTASFADPAAAGGDTVSARCGVTDAPLRVLIIDTVARWETRHLAAALQRSIGIDVDVAFLGTGVAQNVPETPAACRAFDVIVLGLFDPRDLPAGAAEAIAAAVRDDGLGLVWALDGRSDLATVALSELGDLLPCRPVMEPRVRPAAEPFRVRATPAAAGFPWMTPLQGWVEQPEAAVYLPAVTVACRPTAVAALTLFGTTPPPPVLLVDRVGSGRILTSLAETWRWRAAGHAADVDALWQDAVRFVAEPRLRSRFGETRETAADETIAWREDSKPLAPLGRRNDVASSAPSAGFRWNHPLLVVIVVAVAAAGWWLASAGPPSHPEDKRKVAA